MWHRFNICSVEISCGVFIDGLSVRRLNPRAFNPTKRFSSLIKTIRIKWMLIKPVGYLSPAHKPLPVWSQKQTKPFDRNEETGRVFFFLKIRLFFIFFFISVTKKKTNKKYPSVDSVGSETKSWTLHRLLTWKHLRNQRLYLFTLMFVNILFKNEAGIGSFLCLVEIFFFFFWIICIFFKLIGVERNDFQRSFWRFL